MGKVYLVRTAIFHIYPSWGIASFILVGFCQNLLADKRNSAPHFLFVHNQPHRSCTAIESEYQTSNLYCYEKTISFNRAVSYGNIFVVQVRR